VSARTIGVLGGGLMGSGIAQVAAQAGFDTVVREISPALADKSRANIERTLAKGIEKGKVTAEARDAAMAKLRFVTDVAALADRDVVIEAVVEDLETKNALWRELNGICPPKTIFASNTSSLTIAAMAVASGRPDRVVGLHFFNPVPLMKLVEVIRAADTAPWVTDAMVALGKRQTRVPVVVGDTPGFLVNLGGTAIGTEGLRIYQEGRASPAQVDAVMRDSCGFRMGPFELMDLTGIDVNFPARKIIYEGFFHDRRMTPSPYHESLYAAGRLGRKTGGGWYAYDAKGGKVDPGADHLPSVVPATRVVVMDSHNEKLVGLVMAAGAQALGADDGRSPILVAPIGKDCTTTVVERGLDPRRTVAIDLTGDIAKRLTIMTAPGADDLVRDSAAAILARTGAKVTLIKDSPGFIAQRMCAMIANLGCEMAMIGIASAADVDTAMTLGLNYPRGPLALADWLGVKDCHEILVQLQAITGDDRYRPSQWLRRRAQLGLSATTLE